MIDDLKSFITGNALRFAVYADEARIPLMGTGFSATKFYVNGWNAKTLLISTRENEPFTILHPEVDYGDGEIEPACEEVVKYFQMDLKVAEDTPSNGACFFLPPYPFDSIELYSEAYEVKTPDGTLKKNTEISAMKINLRDIPPRRIFPLWFKSRPDIPVLEAFWGEPEWKGMNLLHTIKA